MMHEEYTWYDSFMFRNRMETRRLVLHEDEAGVVMSIESLVGVWKDETTRLKSCMARFRRLVFIRYQSHTSKNPTEASSFLRLGTYRSLAM